MDKQTQEAMTREEWQLRYAARMKERAALDDKTATELAEVGAASFLENESMFNAAFLGGDAIVWTCPEEEADEELSHWTDDGD